MTDTVQWRVIATSVVGRSHIEAQRGCEDAFYPHNASAFNDSTLVIAVADGLGSATFAAQGAQFAVEKAVTLFHAHCHTCGDMIDPCVISEVFASVRQELILMADANHVDVTEYACTLQLVALNASQLVGGHVGDGLILGVRPVSSATDDNVVDILSIMPRTTKLSEYDNATHTIVSPYAIEHLRIIQIDQHNFDMYDGVILMTDGAQMLCYEYRSQTLFQSFFVEMMKWIQNNNSQPVSELSQQLTRFFQSDDVIRQTKDDITFVFARHHE
jgi:serine/threonine protein phosphatase PrpC